MFKSLPLITRGFILIIID